MHGGPSSLECNVRYSRDSITTANKDVISKTKHNTATHVQSTTMATQRRINTTEKTHLDQDEVKSGPKSNITPAVPSFVPPKRVILSDMLLMKM